MMETLTRVEGWWVNRASTTTWNTHSSVTLRGRRPHQAGGRVGGTYLGDRLPPDQHGVRILLAGVEQGNRALDLHDAVATLKQTGWDWMAARKKTHHACVLCLWESTRLLQVPAEKRVWRSGY